MPYMLEGDPRLADVEAKVRNKWRWEWLDETDSSEAKRSHRHWCQKLQLPGTCFCTVCSKPIKYGMNGKKKLREHADHPDHQKNIKVINNLIKY